jgi:DNA-binding MarR family transcriptional regulator
MTTTAVGPDHTTSSPEPLESLLDLEMLQAARAAGDPLSLMQLRALLLLFDLGTQSAQGIADRLQVERSAVDALSPALVIRGFVIQIPHGSSDNSSAIVLSTAGRRFVTHLRYRNTDTFRRGRTNTAI